MGISANQARLLTLTARQHDLELRAQQISARKMALMHQSQAFATTYANNLKLIQSNGIALNSTPASVREVIGTGDSRFYVGRSDEYCLHKAGADSSTDHVASELVNTSNDVIGSYINDGYRFYRRSWGVINAPEQNPAPSNIDVATANAIADANKDSLQPSDIIRIMLGRGSSTSFKWTFEKVSIDERSALPNGTKTYNVTIKNLVDTTQENVNFEDRFGVNSNGATLEEYRNGAAAWDFVNETDATDFSNTFLMNGDVFITAQDIAQALGNNLYVTPSAVQSANEGGAETTEPEYGYIYEELNMSMTILGDIVNEGNIDNIDNSNIPSLESAKADYDAAMAGLSSIEKILDMELTQIDTEHKAVKTEYDAVKSLISDNVEKSFNVFG